MTIFVVPDDGVATPSKSPSEPHPDSILNDEGHKATPSNSQPQGDTILHFALRNNLGNKSPLITSLISNNVNVKIEFELFYVYI